MSTTAEKLIRLDGIKQEFKSLIGTESEEFTTYPQQIAKGMVDGASEQEWGGSRETAGGAAIKDGVALVQSVKGRSIVWNQLLDWSKGYAGYQCTVTRDGDAYIVIGTETANSQCLATHRQDVIQGHEYLFAVETMTDAEDVRATFTLGLGYMAVPKSTTWVRTAKIVQCTSSGTTRAYMNSLACHNYKFKNFTLHDLTQMFGAGNEPTTYEEFLAKKPMVADEYAYTPGTLISNRVTEVVSRGENGEVLSTRSLPTLDYFPDGLRSAGSVYDELTEDKAIQRVGVRDGVPYVLDTPIVTPIDPPLNTFYRVENGGTEQAVADGDSAPFRADITYPKEADGKYGKVFEARTKDTAIDDNLCEIIADLAKGEQGLSYLFFNSKLTGELKLDLTTIGSNSLNNAFRGSNGITKIEFTQLASHNSGMPDAFIDCKGVNTVSFPKLTSTNSYGMQRTFQGCSVESVSIPLWATGQCSPSTINDAPFRYCTKLTTAEIHPNQLAGTGAGNIFAYVTTLVNLSLTATATNNVFLTWETALSSASVLNVLNHLSTSASGKTCAFANLTISSGDSNYAAIKAKVESLTNWTISGLTL